MKWNFNDRQFYWIDVELKYQRATRVADNSQLFINVVVVLQTGQFKNFAISAAEYKKRQWQKLGQTLIQIISHDQCIWTIQWEYILPGQFWN